MVRNGCKSTSPGKNTQNDTAQYKMHCGKTQHSKLTCLDFIKRGFIFGLIKSTQLCVKETELINEFDVPVSEDLAQQKNINLCQGSGTTLNT